MEVGKVFCSRRQALKSMALSAIAFASDSILFADTVSPADSKFLSEANLRFEKLIKCKFSGLETNSALYHLCSYSKENYDLFSTWYKDQVKKITSEPMKNKEEIIKESLLEEIGRVIINDSGGYLYPLPEANRPKYISEFLDSLMKVIA